MTAPSSPPVAGRTPLVELRERLAAVAGPAVRREAGAERPLGPKASRTRAQLLEAAYHQFCEAGYQGSSVADIAERAGVSLGTFYQYFRDRADILGTLVAEWVAGAVADPVTSPPASPGAVARTIRAFVEHYAATAPFQKVWEEVTHTEPELADLRRLLQRVYEHSAETALRAGMAAGTVRADLEPAAAARAVTAMIDRYCWLTYVFDPPDPPPDPADTAALLSELITSALGIEGS